MLYCFAKPKIDIKTEEQLEEKENGQIKRRNGRERN